MEAMDDSDREYQQYESQMGQGESNTNMQLLTVPSSDSPGGTLSVGSSRDSKFLRRYSCNPQGKGTNVHQEGTTSPLLRYNCVYYTLKIKRQII